MNWLIHLQTGLNVHENNYSQNWTERFLQNSSKWMVHSHIELNDLQKWLNDSQKEPWMTNRSGVNYSFTKVNYWFAHKSNILVYQMTELLFLSNWLIDIFTNHIEQFTNPTELVRLGLELTTHWITEPFSVNSIVKTKFTRNSWTLNGWVVLRIPYKTIKIPHPYCVNDFKDHSYAIWTHISTDASIISCLPGDRNHGNRDRPNWLQSHNSLSTWHVP